MKSTQSSENIFVLGTSQDGGYPQSGCWEECCADAWSDPKLRRLISSLAILSDNDCWIIDITPDFSYQFKMIKDKLNGQPNICGIFITHAHIGHYLGLLQLGLEIMNTSKIPVYVMPRMKCFLEENAPFTQLIKLNNIKLRSINENTVIMLNDTLSIKPFLVPHRNEFSETIGLKVQSEDTFLLYIPDIDSWDIWDVNIIDLIRRNDLIILDGTFYSKKELLGRNMNDVPHPCIKESIKRFSHLDKVDRDKVYFTHLNHSNPAINISSFETKELISKGFHIAEDKMVFTL